MSRQITYTTVITYDIDEVMAQLAKDNPEMTEEELEQEARETIEEWAHEDFGSLGFTTSEETSND